MTSYDIEGLKMDIDGHNRTVYKRERMVQYLNERKIEGGENMSEQAKVQNQPNGKVSRRNVLKAAVAAGGNGRFKDVSSCKFTVWVFVAFWLVWHGLGGV